MSPRSDASIRNLVAELSTLHADDVAAILAALPDRERDTVKGYLTEHEPRFEAMLAESGVNAPFGRACISPWLATAIYPAEPERSAMTDHARRAALACAAKLYPSSRRAT